MATASMEKDFIIKDETALETYLEEIEKKSKKRSKKTIPSPSLEKGRKKLKQFSFR